MHGEMGAGEVLIVVQEGGIHGRTSKRSNGGHRLGGDFLRDDHPEPGTDLGQQAHDGRGALADGA